YIVIRMLSSHFTVHVAPSAVVSPLSLHDALPICLLPGRTVPLCPAEPGRAFGMSRTSQRAARPGGALISAQVVQTLLAELRTGRYASAARLPPELTLARTLGVSRSVVRDALGELERAGYVERVRGIGTLVNRGALAVRRLDRKLEFTQMILAAGRTPHTDHL